MHSCPWPSCDYEGREREHLRQHLEAKHGGKTPSTEEPEEERRATPLARALSILLVGVAVIVGSYQRVQMGTLDALQKFDPYEHFHLARYWMENWRYMVRDQLLFPTPSGQHPGVGYPPLTHFEPAALTEVLNSLGYDVSLVQVMAFLPIVLMGLATVAMFFLGRELYDEKAGVIAALLTAVFPSFIEVGRAGAYDTNLHLFLFTIATLALFVKALNQDTRGSRLYWGALGGVSLGLFALHWAGYVMFLGFLGISILIYTAVASIVDRVEPGVTYSFVGVMAAIPVMAYWYLPKGGLGEIKYVFYVGLLALFPAIAYGFPGFVEERVGVEDGRRIRHYVSAAGILLVAFAVYYAIEFGRLPGGINVPGVGMFQTQGSYQVTIAELQSAFRGGQKPLANAFGLLGGFEFGASYIPPIAIFPIPFLAYMVYRDFHAKRFLELTFVLLTFFMMFEAARFLEPFVAVVTVTVGGFFAWALDLAGMEDLRESMEAVDFGKVAAVLALIALILGASTPVVANGGSLGKVQPAIYYESNGAWVDTYRHMAQSPEFDESTAVMSWWDYGFPAKAISRVQYVSDNTQGNIEIPAKFYVMQNLTEGRRYLTEELMQERGEDVEYVVGNKYLGFSGKWHATVTVAATETDMGTPNLFDRESEPGEGTWTFGYPEVPPNTERSNYYKLSFYNASRYGVGDEPYPGYEIVYQSPQWYIRTSDGRLGIVPKRQLEAMNFSENRIIGPAITIYRLQKNY